jgi:hypothetical protein
MSVNPAALWNCDRSACDRRFVVRLTRSVDRYRLFWMRDPRECGRFRRILLLWEPSG